MCLDNGLTFAFKGHFPGKPGLAGVYLKQRMMEVVVTTGLLPHWTCKLLASNHWREKYHIPWTCLP